MILIFQEPPKKRKKRPIREPSDHSEDETEVVDDEDDTYPQVNTPVDSEAEIDADSSAEESDSD